jgi:hypothetical protein
MAPLIGLFLLAGSAMRIKAIIDPPTWNRLCTDFVGIVFEFERMRTVTGHIGRSMMSIAVLFYVFA